MSDPSGGNVPPGGGGTGSKVPGSSSGAATPTITDQSATGEPLPDPDEWGSASEPPIVGIPVKTPAAYAATEMMPIQPEVRAPQPTPGPTATLAGDAPAIGSSGETAAAARPATGTAPGTAPFAAQAS